MKSNRKRGYDARINIKRLINENSNTQYVIIFIYIIVDIIILIINKAIYSLKKIIVNKIDPYSTLYPLTNSDSPSAKSKGARFVSATIIKMINTNKNSIFIVKK